MPRLKTKQTRTRGASRFKVTETARLVRAAIEAGLTVRGIEVDTVGGMLRVLAENKPQPVEQTVGGA
jgi:hypothetical protein